MHERAFVDHVAHRLFDLVERFERDYSVELLAPDIRHRLEVIEKLAWAIASDDLCAKCKKNITADDSELCDGCTQKAQAALR